MIELSQFKTATLLVKIGNAVTYYRNRKMEDLDLTSVQSDVLIDILRNPGITASEIKEHIQLSQSTVAGIIGRLEGKRLISKVGDEKDGRKVILYPAEQGRGLAGTRKARAVETRGAVWEGLDGSAPAELARLLEKSLNNLNRVRNNN